MSTIAIVAGRMYQITVPAALYAADRDAYQACQRYAREFGGEHGTFDGRGYRVEVPGRAGYRIAARIGEAARLGCEVREVAAAEWMGATLTPAEMIALQGSMERAADFAGHYAERYARSPLRESMYAYIADCEDVADEMRAALDPSGSTR